MSLPFKQVDVFTSKAFKGNPVAVFFEADNLSSEQMQSIANWTNLSETTFVLKPTDSKADYKLRIFTPVCELPFAGHPTIGSAHAIIEQGGLIPKGKETIIQQCGAGLVEIKVRDNGSLQFKLPYYKHEPFVQDLSVLTGPLGIKKEDIVNLVHVDDGPNWTTIQLTSGELVSSLKPKFDDIPRGIELSIFGKNSDGTYEARNFFRMTQGYIEDPVCGSGAGADASLLAEKEGFEGDFTIRQGRQLGRDGYVQVSVVKKPNGESGSDVFVGGNAVTVLQGAYTV